jgi:biopolymer transport protein TolR
MSTTAALSAPQRLQIARAVRANDRRAAQEHAGELNVIPFLDIVMNVLMFVLATTATVFTASITPTVPQCCGRGAAQMATVHVTPTGYVVATAVGATAVPLRAGRYDAAGLSRSLAALRAAATSPAEREQRTVQVSAVGAVPYGELVRAIDASRETRPGAGDLFPEVTLGVVR